MIDFDRACATSARVLQFLPGFARQDDRAVFEALVDAHYRRIYNRILRIVRSEEEAADLTQEAFVRAYRAFSHLRAEGASSAWLRRIATNLALDHLRRRKTAVPTVPLDPLTAEGDFTHIPEIADTSMDPLRLSLTNERARVIRAAVQELSDDYRIVIVLHHMEDMGVEEIAEILHAPVGTVKSRLSRARKALQRRLASFFSA